MLRKLFWSLLVILFLFLAAVISVPFLFKKQIIAKVKTTINDNLNAKVDFGDFDISLLRSFPDLSISLNDLTVIGIDTFKNDTLANIKELFVKVDVMTVIRGEPIAIKYIRLEQPTILAKVLKNGKANWDIAKVDTTAPGAEDTSTTEFTIALEKYELVDGVIIYDDASLEFYTKLTGVDHVGSGDFTQDLFVLETQTDAKQFSMSYGGISYLSNTILSAHVPLEMDMKKSIYTFKDNEAKLNELLLNFAGSIEMPADDITMDLKFSAEKSEFKNFLSLIPAIYAADFKDLKSSGKFAMEGYLRGVYNEKSMPGFGLKMQVENGAFNYPSLPSGVSNVQVNASIVNPDGVIDHTIVEVSTFHLEMAKSPFDARLILKTPISDPDIDFSMNGRIDLAEISKIVPLPDTKLSGIMTTDMAAKGRLSSVQQGRYYDFKASGTMGISNFNYESKDTPKPVSISNAQMTFNPRNISLVSLNAKVGKSDFSASGSLENYLAYALKDEAIVGKLNLNSNLIDVNELMGPETAAAATPTAETPMTVVEVPGNVDFVMNASIKKVLYDNLDLDNVQGQIIVRNKSLSFKNVGLNTLDGKVSLNGSYSTADVKKPMIDMNFGVENMDIQKAFNAFNTVQKMAPAGKYASGRFNTKMSFRSDLGADMSPLMNTLNGEGSMDLLNGKLSGFAPLEKLTSALKMEKYSKMDLKNIRIKFKFSEGRVRVEPFDIKQGALAMNIGGSNGFDQTIDYKAKLSLPRSEFGSQANDALTGLLAAANKNGADINMGDKVNVNALIGGTVTQPSVKLDLSDMKNQVKSAITDIIDSKKKELEAKAKAEADRLRAEGEAKAKAELDKLKAEGDAKKKELEAKAKAEADRIKAEADKKKKEAEEKAKQEAKDKLKGLLKK